MSLFSTFVLCISLSAVTQQAYGKVVICYYGSWSTYHEGDLKFDVTDIDPTLCTHMVYAFAGLGDDSRVKSLDPYLDLPDNGGRDYYHKFNELKSKNANVKTLLGVGGWNAGSAKFSTMAASPNLRSAFIASAKEMLKNFGFDGMDVDWEYPAQRDSTNGAADVNNFTELLKEMKEAFEQDGLLLTVAVAAAQSSASQSYDIPNMSKYVDYVNVMAYDMHDPSGPVTGNNAPLHRGGDADDNNVEVVLQYWLGQGCPPEKLVLGMPLYGHTFLLSDPNNNSVKAASRGKGMKDGILGYNEICTKLQGFTVNRDAASEVPYAYKDSDWISYDDSDSLTKKVQYAVQLNLAGVMVWSIDTDDFRGQCGEAYPLLKAINAVQG